MKKILAIFVTLVCVLTSMCVSACGNSELKFDGETDYQTVYAAFIEAYSNDAHKDIKSFNRAWIYTKVNYKEDGKSAVNETNQTVELKYNSDTGKLETRAFRQGSDSTGKTFDIETPAMMVLNDDFFNTAEYDYYGSTSAKTYNQMKGTESQGKFPAYSFKRVDKTTGDIAIYHFGSHGRLVALEVQTPIRCVYQGEYTDSNRQYLENYGVVGYTLTYKF